MPKTEVKMTTWKLTIKPDNIDGYDPFQLCKKKSLLGVGWAGAYRQNQATNINDAKRLVKAEYGNWPDQIKYLLEDVKKDVRSDLINAQQVEKAEKESKEFLASLKSDESVDSEKKKYDPPFTETGFFNFPLSKTQEFHIIVL